MICKGTSKSETAQGQTIVKRGMLQTPHTFSLYNSEFDLNKRNSSYHVDATEKQYCIRVQDYHVDVESFCLRSNTCWGGAINNMPTFHITQTKKIRDSRVSRWPKSFN